MVEIDSTPSKTSKTHKILNGKIIIHLTSLKKINLNMIQFSKLTSGIKLFKMVKQIYKIRKIHYEITFLYKIIFYII